MGSGRLLTSRWDESNFGFLALLANRLSLRKESVSWLSCNGPYTFQDILTSSGLAFGEAASQVCGVVTGPGFSCDLQTESSATVPDNRTQASFEDLISPICRLKGVIDRGLLRILSAGACLRAGECFQCQHGGTPQIAVDRGLRGVVAT